MAGRNGEKAGWTVGWLGAFAWVAVVSVVFLAQARWVQGLAGLALVGLAVASIVSLAPWRHPSTRYWRLMIPLYVVLFASLPWAIWAWGGVMDTGLGWWSLCWLLPLLMPLGSIGGKRWSDDARPSAAVGADPQRR